MLPVKKAWLTPFWVDLWLDSPSEYPSNLVDATLLSTFHIPKFLNLAFRDPLYIDFTHLPITISSLFSLNFMLRKIRISWLTYALCILSRYPNAFNHFKPFLFISPLILRHTSANFNSQQTRIRCFCSSWNFAPSIFPSFMIYLWILWITPMLLNIQTILLYFPPHFEIYKR